MNDNARWPSPSGRALPTAPGKSIFPVAPFFLVVLACGGQRKKPGCDIKDMQRSVGWCLLQPVKVSCESSARIQRCEQSATHSVNRFPPLGPSARLGYQRILSAASPLEV